MLIRERLGRIRGKFKGGPGSLGVFATSTSSPPTRQPNPAHTSLRARATSSSSVSGGQSAPPQLEHQVASGRNATREEGLRASAGVFSPSEDPLCESVDVQGASVPLTISSLDPATPAPTDPAPHASILITNPTSPPAYTCIDGTDNSPGQAPSSEPVVQVAPLGDDDVSNRPGVAEKNRIDLFDATPATLAIPSTPQPTSTSNSLDVDNTAQATSPSSGLSSAAPTCSLLATSGVADATAALKPTKRTYAYLAEWDTRPLFPLYFLSILVLLIPFIL